jgi:CMP/dCMP kinase
VVVFSKNIIISVDGYSSCGKSTFARSLAEKLGYIYIDSGAMYRAMTILCLKNGIILNGKIDTKRLKSILENIDIKFIFNENNNKSEVYLNGENVENEIRSVEIANNVSLISKIPEIREKLVSIQRSMGENKRIVMDGRDIGTVVFPDAEIKIFMTADINIRAERRYKELLLTLKDITFDSVKENLVNRDYIDVHRKESPLIMADDAILLDNSNMNQEEQLNWGLKLINRKYQTIVE